MSTIIVGAQWCGYSQKQFDALQCTESGDGAIACTIEEKVNKDSTETKKIDFVWCEDENREKILDSAGNPIHDACDPEKLEDKTLMTGYPAWIHKEDDKLSVMQTGMVDPCNDNVKQFFSGCSD